MGLLQELPNPEQLGSILALVVSDKAAESGVAGVLNLLDLLYTTNLSVCVAVKLNRNFSLNVSGDASALIGCALSNFQPAVNAFRKDLAALIQPLSAKPGTIKNLYVANLSRQPLRGVDSRKKIESLVPPKVRVLIAGVADRIIRLLKVGKLETTSTLGARSFHSQRSISRCSGLTSRILLVYGRRVSHWTLWSGGHNTYILRIPSAHVLIWKIEETNTNPARIIGLTQEGQDEILTFTEDEGSDKCREC
ncbi:MAG: hypothetical protein WBD99_10785 [Thermodesulfobacteriota bacterium]